MLARHALAAMLLGVAAYPAAAQDAQSLVAKNLEARGGAASIDAIRSKGAFVWAVFDCCHSGGIHRDGVRQQGSHGGGGRFAFSEITGRAEAFARECGLTTIKLKNFRSKWVGATEGNVIVNSAPPSERNSFATRRRSDSIRW